MDSLPSEQYKNTSLGYLGVTNLLFEAAWKDDETAYVFTGAFRNGGQISVSTIDDIKGAAFMTEFGYDRTKEGVQMMLGNIEKLLTNGAQTLRSAGSCALNMCGGACRH